MSAYLDRRTAIRRAERRVVALEQADALASTAVLRDLSRASTWPSRWRAPPTSPPELFEGRSAERPDG